MSSGQGNSEISNNVGTTLTRLHEAPIVAGALCKDSFTGGAGGRPEAAAAGHFVPVAYRPQNFGDSGGGYVEAEISNTLDSIQGSKQQHVVAHALRGEGFDASEDGTGRGTPLVPVCVPDVGSTLTSGGTGTRGRLDPVNTDLIAFDSRQDCISSGEHFGALSSRTPQAQAVALRGREGGATAELSEIPSALRASGGGGDKAHVLNAMQVRRLTPRECERLQGFPDDYTLITVRNKPAADGPRYKALGNSMAVPVMQWIGKRIDMVEAVQ